MRSIAIGNSISTSPPRALRPWMGSLRSSDRLTRVDQPTLVSFRTSIHDVSVAFRQLSSARKLIHTINNALDMLRSLTSDKLTSSSPSHPAGPEMIRLRFSPRLAGVQINDSAHTKYLDTDDECSTSIRLTRRFGLSPCHGPTTLSSDLLHN